MSGDVQPRKRKDKKRKRDALDRKSDGEVTFSRKSSLQDDDEASHGVHITKMGNDDVHLHVHHDHESGGHWCAKIIFFSLMAVLLGLVGLIILENRGISDLDTPLSESRFSNYFDGWVEEHRVEHDEHDAVQASIEEHEEHDEPFEEEDEEENLSELDDEDHEDEEHAEAEEDDDDEEDEDEGADNKDDEEDDENATEEKTTELEDDDEDRDGGDENDNDEVTKEIEDGEDDEDEHDNDVEDQTVEEGDDDDNNNVDDDDDGENTAEDKDNEDNDNDNDKDDDEDDNDDDEGIENDNDEDEDVVVKITQHTTTAQQQSNSKIENDDNDDAFDDDDDDDDDGDNFDSLENVIDNDAEEMKLLERKAAQQAAIDAHKNKANVEAATADEATAPSWASSQIKPKKSLSGGPKASAIHDDDDDDDDNDGFDLFEQELRRVNEEMMRENYPVAMQAFSLLTQKYPDQPRVFLEQAKALDRISKLKRSNQLLNEALNAYKRYLAFGDTITNDTEFRKAAERCIERMRFLGIHQQAVPIQEQLIERFSDEVEHRTELMLTYLMINKFEPVKSLALETLARWPSDGCAQVYYGLALKELDKDYKNAVIYLTEGINSRAEGTQKGIFYFSLGEALQRLGRQSEAFVIYGRGVDAQIFASVYQRSLYNEPNLRAQPFWTLEETGYAEHFQKLEQNWLAIRDEGMSLVSRSGYFINDGENLLDTGDWKQFELYVRGQRQRNCQKAPITCGIIAQFNAASTCRRGQVKFSVMHPGTHVWPHCGPTNCRLRAHLGLVVPTGTYLRVAKEQRTWHEGKFVIFDDSFEHEVWHNGSSIRLVLIVDVWHPDLSVQQRQSLTAI